MQCCRQKSTGLTFVLLARSPLACVKCVWLGECATKESVAVVVRPQSVVTMLALYAYGDYRRLLHVGDGCYYFY